jgi:hypothetical protein
VLLSVVVAGLLSQFAGAATTTLDVTEDTDITNWVNWETGARGLLMDGEDFGRGGSLRVADQDFPGGYAVNDGWILLRWDLSSIPAEHTISSVTLRLTQFDGAVGATEVWAIDQGDWEEEFTSWVSWTSQTTSETLLGIMQNVSINDPELMGNTTFVDADLTTRVQDWHAGSKANLGLLLKWAGGPQDGDTFASRESTTDDPAQLIITHSDPSSVTPGDYNQSGTVDAADYTVWRDTLGSTTNLSADGDGSLTIDAGDYTVWQTNFGMGAGSVSISAIGVPEPSAMLLSVVGLAAIGVRMARRRMDVPAIH